LIHYLIDNYSDTKAKAIFDKEIKGIDTISEIESNDSNKELLLL
jgi:hypothetical protein